ncbi:CASP C terminal-domain-containing protein [Haematococcus lacustris]
MVATGGSQVGADQSSPAVLSAVYRSWQGLDLESLRVQMDEVGMKIAEHQEEAMQNRKKLAEATREFKRQAPDIKGMGPLLKQYQDEIDRLSKRSKHSETAYLELYQKLYEAPDPAPALATALETASRAAELEAQCRKIAQELAEYKAESSSIKNQDLTIRKLEDRVRGLEAALEEKGLEVAEARAQAEAEADAARMAQMQERELQLTAMLAEAQASLVSMQRLHTSTQNQLFSLQSQSEEEQLSRQVELELASSELDRAQERLVALEREKQRLQQQLGEAGAPGGPAAGGLGGSSSSSVGGQAGAVLAVSSIEETVRNELHTQREVAARLRLEVLSLREELDQAHSMWEARLEGTHSSLRATEQHCRALEDELSMRPTTQQMDELRAQIRLLQAVGYNSLVEDDDDDDRPGAARNAAGHQGRRPEGGQATGQQLGGGAGSGGGSGGRGNHATVGSLEALLLQKNRHLEHELTMARLRIVDASSQLEASAAQVAELEANLAARQALVDRLEEDLVASRRAAMGPGKPRGSGGAALSGLLKGDDQGPGARAGRGGGVEEEEEEEGSGDSSMIRVVCSQRDRFRAKVLELEEELSRVRAELAATKSQAATAKADNIALVERLRYVHSFKAQQRTGAGAGAGTTGDMEAGAEAERRYGRLYEERLNPFKEFQGEQRDKQRSKLHVADQLMFMFGQLVFGSQGARLGTFAYLVVLHLLVVGSLMRMTHQSSAALFDHQQVILDQRHDLAAMMHHEGPAGAAGTSTLRLP